MLATLNLCFPQQSLETCLLSYKTVVGRGLQSARFPQIWPWTTSVPSCQVEDQQNSTTEGPRVFCPV